MYNFRFQTSNVMILFDHSLFFLFTVAFLRLSWFSFSWYLFLFLFLFFYTSWVLDSSSCMSVKCSWQHNLEIQKYIPFFFFDIVPFYINSISIYFQWDGTLLATGSYDGQARIWSKNGNGCSIQVSLNISCDPYHPFYCLRDRRQSRDDY